jgi:hypothetical protein
MRNLIIYYFGLILPLPLLVLTAHYDSIIFVTLLASYYIFRGFLDGSRLVSLGLITQDKIWKSFIPFWTAMYFKELYFSAHAR